MALFNYRARVIKQALIDMTRGEITFSEANFLKEIVGSIETPGTIVEIGTLFGKSTLAIASSKSPECELITVDNYSWNPLGLPGDIHFEITQHLLADAIEKYSVKSLNLDKADFFIKYKSLSPSIVFLDAIHTYDETKKDILWAKQTDTKIICGHDYDKVRHPEVVKAVDEFGGPSKVIESLWIL
jgi:hypothetical protein